MGREGLDPILLFVRTLTQAYHFRRLKDVVLASAVAVRLPHPPWRPATADLVAAVLRRRGSHHSGASPKTACEVSTSSEIRLEAKVC